MNVHLTGLDQNNIHVHVYPKLIYSGLQKASVSENKPFKVTPCTLTTMYMYTVTNTTTHVMHERVRQNNIHVLTYYLITTRMIPFIIVWLILTNFR